ncbi:NfeD family protein, partial [Pontibacterium sp.]|uniref:NfeD family protein n=1 Tax=Pontibacterium sp. TaxID=2036026 RepID=UPI0035172C78
LAMALRSRKAAVVSGSGMLIGKQAIAMEDFQNLGKVKLHGEIWNAQSDYPIHAGETVTVLHVKGLMLEVRKSDSPSSGDSS